MFKRLTQLLSRRRSKQEGGQSLVEVALMMPVLLLMLMGVFDLGRMYFAFIAIQNAAGEGALYAAINPTCVYASDDCVDPDNAVFRATHESPAGIVDWSRVTIEVSPADVTGLSEGDPITIFVHYDYDILTPVVAPLFPSGQIRLTARGVQNIIDLKE